MRYWFGQFNLDTDLGRLRRAGEIVPLRPLPLRLLLVLLENRHRVVSSEELLAAVWPGTAVSWSALSSALRDLRRALDDSGARQHTIETLRGRGYRFVAYVHVEDDAIAPGRPLVGPPSP